MKISIIVAASTNHAIGKDNWMPWRLSDDLKRFKALTLGHTVIMGRKTGESLKKPLPGRTNIIITRNPDFQLEGFETVHSLEDALTLARKAGEEEAFIIGGGEIYRQAWNLADTLYLTRVHTEVEGDTYIPEVDLSDWKEAERSDHSANEKNEYDYSFITYTRP